MCWNDLWIVCFHVLFLSRPMQAGMSHWTKKEYILTNVVLNAPSFHHGNATSFTYCSISLESCIAIELKQSLNACLMVDRMMTCCVDEHMANARDHIQHKPLFNSTFLSWVQPQNAYLLIPPTVGGWDDNPQMPTLWFPPILCTVWYFSTSCNLGMLPHQYIWWWMGWWSAEVKCILEMTILQYSPTHCKAWHLLLDYSPWMPCNQSLWQIDALWHGLLSLEQHSSWCRGKDSAHLTNWWWWWYQW